MRNSPWLPAAALVIAIVLGVFTLIQAANTPGPLSELHLGYTAAVLGLGIYGIQGFVSVAVEGEELRPGRIPPRLTDPFSLAILILGVGLIILAGFLIYGIAADWATDVLGLLAGGGSIIIAILLMFYKEAFVGDEVSFDDREDGVPW